MLSYKQLEQRLETLDNTSNWFFMSLDCGNNAVKQLNFTDLLKLPKPYIQNLIVFFSTHWSDSYLVTEYGASIFKFIKKATGLDWQLALKLMTTQEPMEIAKALRDFGEIDELQYKEMVTNIRKDDIEKDFV